MGVLQVYLPIVGLELNLLLLLLVGFTVGICGGFFGIGGAWIVTPALNIFGFPMPYAIGTDLAHIGGKSIVSTLRHGKFGNVDYRLGGAMIAGTTSGMELGARLVLALERAGLAESAIRWAYVGLLSLIGSYILLDSVGQLRRQRGRTGGVVEERADLAMRLQRLHLPPMVHFREAGITTSLWLPVLVGAVTGLVASTLGVGAGFVRLPALIYLIGCRTVVAVGTDLFEVMITGAYGAFTYALKGRVDLIAALWMLVGASVGAQLGAVAVKYVHGHAIRVLFAVTVFLACASVLLKQLHLQLPSTILILAAGGVISTVIAAWLVRGVVGERAARRTAMTRP